MNVDEIINRQIEILAKFNDQLGESNVLDEQEIKDIRENAQVLLSLAHFTEFAQNRSTPAYHVNDVNTLDPEADSRTIEFLKGVARETVALWISRLLDVDNMKFVMMDIAENFRRLYNDGKHHPTVEEIYP